jgi:hypothetical protein
MIPSKKKEKNMVENKKGEGRFIKVLKKKSCAKEIFQSINGCKHPLIASGANSIGSAGRAPENIKAKNKEAGKTRRQYI